jgi:hypothetical protein
MISNILRSYNCFPLAQSSIKKDAPFPATTEVEEGKMAEAKATTNTPWIEKYRPRSLAQVACQEETISVLKKTLESKNVLPSLYYRLY